MDLLTRINQHYQELTEQGRQMITALQKVDLAWDDLTSSELAKKLYVSRASIFRMLKKLELESFAELKYLIQQEKQSVLNLEQGKKYTDIDHLEHMKICEALYESVAMGKMIDL